MISRWLANYVTLINENTYVRQRRLVRVLVCTWGDGGHVGGQEQKHYLKSIFM